MFWMDSWIKSKNDKNYFKMSQYLHQSFLAQSPYIRYTTGLIIIKILYRAIMTTAPLKNLIGLSKQEFIQEIENLDEKAFRAKQLWHWVYHRGVQRFSDMTNLSKDFRQKLEEHYVVSRPDVSRDLISVDGTRKWLFRYQDNQEAETVFIPDVTKSGSLCISSQVGCTLTCKFCHTGTQKLVRNLEASEIVQQFMIARDALDDWPSGKESPLMANIVMMGMGEPLYNYENVAKALKIIMDSDGIAFSRRKITLSTSGVVPMIEQCGAELGVNLAISLHAVTNEIRDEIVPLNKKYPIKDLLDACRRYPAASNSKRITFEYVMLKGVNDSLADARELVRLISGIPSKVNLIPFNPWPGSPFECSSKETIRAFAEVVNNAGYAAPVRKTRGQDILAACGQLRSESIRQSKSRRVHADDTEAA